jgi:hypothetical protein
MKTNLAFFTIPPVDAFIVAFSEVITADCVTSVIAVAAGTGEAEGFVKAEVVADCAVAAFRAC